MKTALITGITGQDGSFLSELLMEKGYGVQTYLFNITGSLSADCAENRKRDTVGLRS